MRKEGGMKTLGRALLIAGVLTILQPCAYDELVRVLAPSCPATGHGCCGDTGTGIHQSMDQKASLQEAVQVHPPVIAVRTPALPLIETTVFSGFISGDFQAGTSPPSFNQPLLI
jgi:hypothetical protein